MKLYFNDDYICDANSHEEIFKIIRSRHKDSYYTRLWFEDNRVCIDYGSWSNFYYVTGAEVNNGGEIVPIV